MKFSISPPRVYLIDFKTAVQFSAEEFLLWQVSPQAWSPNPITREV